MPARSRLIAAMLCLSAASAALGAFATAELVLGDRTPPLLRAWDFEDLSGTPALYVSKTVTEDDKNSVALYQLIPEDQNGPASPLGVSTRLEGGGDAVGAYLYAENEGQGVVFGANAIAVSYNGWPAVGMEVNGVNRSDKPGALVRGVDIVNGGNAATQWALGVQTSNAEPAGKPRYGIVLGGQAFGYPHSPASQAGIVVDHIDSGRAIAIAAGDEIALDGRNGNIRMRYNPDSGDIEFLNGEQLRFSIPMD